MENRQCKQLRVAEQEFNQKSNAHDVLDVIWANDLAAIRKAYLYFFLDPRAAGKVLTVENVFDDFDCLRKQSVMQANLKEMGDNMTIITDSPLNWKKRTI
uniref:Type I site-specific deoxyribonuclease n=1 Tax=Rhabditophanes sp. KR3021 TaxID=114890 RepID=A0AC35U187_9BILA